MSAADDLAAAAAILRAHGYRVDAPPVPSPEQMTDRYASELALRAEIMAEHIVTRNGPPTPHAKNMLAAVERHIADMREAVASRTERNAA